MEGKQLKQAYLKKDLFQTLSFSKIICCEKGSIADTGQYRSSRLYITDCYFHNIAIFFARKLKSQHFCEEKEGKRMEE